MNKASPVEIFTY